MREVILIHSQVKVGSPCLWKSDYGFKRKRHKLSEVCYNACWRQRLTGTSRILLHILSI